MQVNMVSKSYMIVTVKMAVVNDGGDNEVIGPKYAVGGLCKIYAQLDKPGVINIYGDFRPSFHIGALPTTGEPQVTIMQYHCSKKVLIFKYRRKK